MKKYWEEETDFIYPEDSLSQKYLRELKSRAIDTDNMVELLLNFDNDNEIMSRIKELLATTNDKIIKQISLKF